MHDGSQATLWDVMDHYNKGGVQNPFLDGGIERLGSSEPEIDDLVAFLRRSPTSAIGAAQKELARQRALSRTKRPQRDTAAAMGTTAQDAGLQARSATSTPQPDAQGSRRIGGR